MEPEPEKLRSLIERSARVRKELADLEAEIAKHLPASILPQQQQAMQRQSQFASRPDHPPTK
jgi:hypothetical protein